MNQAAIDVAVSVVRNAEGRVLLAERNARQVSAGFWELPGGKIDAGETAAQAAARELHEEIGVEAERLSPWIVYEHAFPTRRVRLHFFRVERWHGQPHGREGQRLAWIDPAAPPVGPVLPSNLRALALLGLPAVIHEARVGRGDGVELLLGDWLRVAAGGARWLLLQAPGLAPAQRTLLVVRLRDRCRQSGVAAPRVLLAGSSLEVHRAGCAGAHTAARWPMPPRPPVGLWSVDCADADAAARAQDAGADLVVLAAADAGVLRQVTQRVVVPVYVRAAPGAGLPRAHAGAAGLVVDLRFALEAPGTEQEAA